MTTAVLFIRSRAIDPDDREWLEPVQMCCAFDCATTLLLLGPAAAGAALGDDRFAELQELGDITVLVLDAAPGPHARRVDAQAARQVLELHTKVVQL